MFFYCFSLWFGYLKKESAKEGGKVWKFKQSRRYRTKTNPEGAKRVRIIDKKILKIIYVQYVGSVIKLAAPVELKLELVVKETISNEGTQN